MPNLNERYDEWIEVFGTEEQKKEHREHKERMEKFLDSLNIPIMTTEETYEYLKGIIK